MWLYECSDCGWLGLSRTDEGQWGPSCKLCTDRTFRVSAEPVRVSDTFDADNASSVFGNRVTPSAADPLSQL